MNWWSSVTSAKVLIRSWVTSNHSPVPSDSPTAASNSLWSASPLLSYAYSRLDLCRPRISDGSGGRDDRYRPDEHEERVGAGAGGLQRSDQHLHRHRNVVEHQLDDGVRCGAAGGRAGDQRTFLDSRRRERELLDPPCVLPHTRTCRVAQEGARGGRDRDQRAVEPDQQAGLPGPSHALRPLRELARRRARTGVPPLQGHVELAHDNLAGRWVGHQFGCGPWAPSTSERPGPMRPVGLVTPD